MFKFGYKGSWYINLLILLVLQTLWITSVSANSVIHNGQIESVRIGDSVATICWASTTFLADRELLVSENPLLSYLGKEATSIPQSSDDVDTLLTDERVINLENRILSQVGKGQAGNILDAIDEIDTLPTQEAITLCLRLSDYYLGEAPGELFVEKITKLGERILPYLVQKRNRPINCRKKYHNYCYENIKERNVRIGIAIEAIKQGIIFYAIFPENLSVEAERYLKIIEIFIEDYKKRQGRYPEHLLALREFAWTQYGYKISILNPWGQPYRYFLSQDKHKYRLEIGDDNPLGWPKVEKCWPTSPLERKKR